MAKRTNRLWLNVWNNFIASLKSKNHEATLIGTDRNGNKYFEIPANPSRGKRNPARYFQPVNGHDGFTNERSAEWESWLRHRRIEPPTEEEISKNLAIIEMKKKNAALLEEKYRQDKPLEIPGDIKGMDSFPKYDDYHFGDKYKKE